MQITLVAVLVCVIALRARSISLLYLQATSCLLEAYAAVVFTGLSGAAIPPVLLVVPFAALRVLQERGGFHEVLERFSVPAAWLLAMAVWGLVGAVLLPHYFEAEVLVMRPDRVLGGISLVPLRANSGNITQAAYAIGHVVTFVAARQLITTRARLGHAGRGMVILATLMCGSGLLNLVEYHTGLPSLLELTRTMDGVNESYEAVGFVRIQGTYPEASAYAARMVPLFAFCLALWLHKKDERLAGLVALGSLCILLISTSGTAYASLCVYIPLLVLQMFPTIARYRRWPSTIAKVSGIVGAGVVLATLAWVFELEFTQKFNLLLDRTLFDKLESASGRERGSWNSAALQSFFDTYGLGVGAGSTYASSFPLVLLSNLGLPGALLFVGFLRSIYRPLVGPANINLTPFVLAARQAVLATLVTASFSATVLNIGVQFYLYAAMASIDPRTLAK